jgi:hypothetical protein
MMDIKAKVDNVRGMTVQHFAYAMVGALREADFERREAEAAREYKIWSQQENDL